MAFAIPENITVHLGPPDSNAPNVTIPFPEYISNVASSEIYPTWPENAIRANMYAQISYALNRIYTEWYRSQGYDFDITSSTAYDQSYVPGQDIFENIRQLAGELFNDYLKRPGVDEPLFAAYCDGKEVTCDGLSQWGTVTLARQGKTPYEILTTYYGNNLDIVQNAPVSPRLPSFQRPLSLTDIGEDVRRVQVQLNRVSRNYPAIPKVPTDGIYGAPTREAVEKFQEVFDLPPTGVVDQATWYRLAYLYTSVKRLAELNSEGETLLGTPLQFERVLASGDSGGRVRILQYFLAVLSGFNAQIPPVQIDGQFGPATQSAVTAAQRLFGLPQTGIVDKTTWERLSDETATLLDRVDPADFSAGIQPYPGFVLTQGMRNEFVSVLQNYLIRIASVYPDLPSTSITGYFGPATKAAVTAFQRKFGLTADGVVGPETWRELLRVYDDVRGSEYTHTRQYPGTPLTTGSSDFAP